MKLLLQCVIIHHVLMGFSVFGGIILKCEDQIGTQGNPVTLRCTADYSETGTPCPLQSYKWKKNSTAIFEFKCGDAYSQNKPGYVCDSTVKEITDSLPILTNGIYTLWIQTECDQLESQPFRVTFKDKEPTSPPNLAETTSTPRLSSQRSPDALKNLNNLKDHKMSIVGVVCVIIVCISIFALDFFMAKRREHRKTNFEREMLYHHS